MGSGSGGGWSFGWHKKDEGLGGRGMIGCGGGRPCQSGSPSLPLQSFRHFARWLAGVVGFGRPQRAARVAHSDRLGTAPPTHAATLAWKGAGSEFLTEFRCPPHLRIGRFTGKSTVSADCPIGHTIVRMVVLQTQESCSPSQLRCVPRSNMIEDITRCTVCWLVLHYWSWRSGLANNDSRFRERETV